MTTPTPDNAASATPVAWRYRAEYHESAVSVLGAGQFVYSNAEVWHPDRAEPLYSAATVTALEARIEAEKFETAKWRALYESAAKVIEVQDRRIARITGAGAK